MGEDGHTASLFPNTDALNVSHKLVTENYVKEKKSWRMTLTFSCINEARHIVVMTFGTSKAHMLSEVLFGEHQRRYPVSFVGSDTTPALFITDPEGARLCMS